MPKTQAEAITFVLAPLNMPDFVKDFYELQNFIRNTNAVLVSDAGILAKILQGQPDSYEFRLVIHSGSLNRGGFKRSEVIINELTDHFPSAHNIKLVFITRNQELFPNQEPAVTDHKGDVYLNFNKCNSQIVLESLILYNLHQFRNSSPVDVHKEVSPHMENLNIHFAIQTALKEEFDAFSRDCSKFQPSSYGVNVYKTKFKETMSMSKDDKDYDDDFYIVHQEQMGLVDAAINCSQVISRVNPSFLIMGGVCGGREGMVNTYDIIIPTLIHDYATGKFKGNKLQSLKYVTSMKPSLKKFLEKQTDRIINNMRAIIDPNRKGLISKDFKIIVDEFACGPWVVKTDGFLKEYLAEEVSENIHGLEMESYSILRTGEVVQPRDKYSLVVKSVMDFTNELKSDGQYGEIKAGASYISALCIRALMPILLEFKRNEDLWK